MTVNWFQQEFCVGLAKSFTHLSSLSKHFWWTLIGEVQTKQLAVTMIIGKTLGRTSRQQSSVTRTSTINPTLRPKRLYETAHIWPIMTEFQLSKGPSVSHHISNVMSLQQLFDHFIILYERRWVAAVLQPDHPIRWGGKKGKKMSNHLSGGREFLIKWSIFFFHCPWLRSPSLPVSCK